MTVTEKPVMERGTAVWANPETKEGQNFIADHLEMNGVPENAELTIHSVEDPEEEPTCLHGLTTISLPRMVHVEIPNSCEIPRVSERAFRL